MFGSLVLEIIIGVAFLYFVLATICIGFIELIAWILSLRARNLRKAICNALCHDRKLIKLFYNHHLIQSLGKNSFLGFSHPSYIPDNVFASVLLRLLSEDGNRNIKKIKNTILDMQKGRKNLESNAKECQQETIIEWYKNIMDRYSGRYKKTVNALCFLFAFLVVLPFDIDTIRICNQLRTDPVQSKLIASLAKDTIENTSKPTSFNDRLNKIEKHVDLIDETEEKLVSLKDKESSEYREISKIHKKAKLLKEIRDSQVELDQDLQNLLDTEKDYQELSEKNKNIEQDEEKIKTLKDRKQEIKNKIRISKIKELIAIANFSYNEIQENESIQNFKKFQEQKIIGWTISEWEKTTTLIKIEDNIDISQNFIFKFSNRITNVIKKYQNFLFKILGLLITILAIMQGAPFWFNMLGKLVNLKSSGPNISNKAT